MVGTSVGSMGMAIRAVTEARGGLWSRARALRSRARPGGGYGIPPGVNRVNISPRVVDVKLWTSLLGPGNVNTSKKRAVVSKKSAGTDYPYMNKIPQMSAKP